MKPDDWIRLKHMLEAATEAVSFMRGCTRETLDKDRKLVLAVLRCIEIVGEAASRVGEQTQRENPAIPWAAIVAMRNRLIHAYFDVDLDRVWDTVADDLPPLIRELEKMAPTENQEP